MTPADKRISEVLQKFGEPMEGNVWRVQGTAVIFHKALERIAAHAKIQFDAPQVIRAERDEAVVLVTGRLGDRSEWSFGEALIGTNYRVSGKQAAYVWAMSEKRAKDRVILKLIELSGILYSEEEADEFKEIRPTSTPRSTSSQDKAPASETQEAVDDFKATIDKLRSADAVTLYMREGHVQEWLESLPETLVNLCRSYALERMKKLGWQPKTQLQSNRSAA